MELPSKLLKQIAFNTRPKKEEHIWIVIDISTHEENLHQPLQTNNKQFKIAVTFLTGYNGVLMLQIQLLSFILRKQLQTMKIFYKLPYHQVLMKLKV